MEKHDQDVIMKDPTVLGAFREEDDTKDLPHSEVEEKKLTTSKVSENMGNEHMEIGEIVRGGHGEAIKYDPTVLGPDRHDFE